LVVIHIPRGSQSQEPLYINPLLDRLQDAGIGLKIGNINVNNTGCADDIALFSTQLSDAQIMVSMALDFANLEGCELQPMKSVAIHIRGKEISANDTSLPVSHTDLKTIGRVSCPFYAAFRIVVQAFNNSPRFVLNSCVIIQPLIHNMQNPTQRGFTKGSSPMNAALPVEEAYRILTDEKQNGHLVLLAAKAAFDKDIHSQFHQVKQWIGQADNMEANDWGWSIEYKMCVPIRSSLPPAPDELLRTIYCRCKTNWHTEY
jgi:hypothetical protein